MKVEQAFILIDAKYEFTFFIFFVVRKNKVKGAEVIFMLISKEL